ncbi:hypothetical protein LAZ67_3004789 [Cordylochernes scorpioides]|uniref:RRM domain-containing protein n=1 Tax=Cordylochernes scorpioides TaxID=51811 RepID=A0ABY6KA45_9ARAC|nr:hypothetical protein LAZ67_3004789 [Cordylochernes scorpioides]
MVRPTKIFVGSLADGVTNEDVKPLFEKYGKVVECDVLGKYGFVHMERSEDAEKAIAELSGYSLKGQAIRVMQSINSKPPKTKIFVGSLPQDCKGEELRELFEKYGTVTECAVIGIYGFVHMERIDEAQNAIKELNHYKFKGSYLRVESSTGEKRQGGQEYGGPWRGGFGGGRGRPHPYGRPPVGPHPPPPGMRRGPFRDDMFIGRPDEFPQRRPMKPEFPPRPADDLFFRRPGGPVFDRRPDDFISRRQDDYLTRRPSADFAPPRRPEEFPLHSARRDEFPLRRPEEYPPRRIDDYMTPPKPDDFSRRTSDYGIRRQEEYSPRRSDDFQTRSRPEEMRAYRDDLYPRRSMEYPQRSLAPQNGHPDYYLSHIPEFPVHGYHSGSRHRTTGQSLTCAASPAHHVEEDFWAELLGLSWGGLLMPQEEPSHLGWPYQDPEIQTYFTSSLPRTPFCCAEAPSSDFRGGFIHRKPFIGWLFVVQPAPEMNQAICDQFMGKTEVEEGDVEGTHSKGRISVMVFSRWLEGGRKGLDRFLATMDLMENFSCRLKDLMDDSMALMITGGLGLEGMRYFSPFSSSEVSDGNRVFWIVFDFYLLKKMDQRTCIKFCVKNEIKCADAFRMLTVAYGVATLD